MAVWEYRKINLSEYQPRGDELDRLNAAGADGWELVGITSNNIAYLKRSIEEHAPAPEVHSRVAASVEQSPNANDRYQRAAGASDVRVKYRDPDTNETWSGRGRMANWLKRKQDAGEEIEKYLV
jgi:H-NS histone family